MAPDQKFQPNTNRRSVLAFILLSMVALGSVVAYAFYSRSRVQQQISASDTPVAVSEDQTQLAALQRQPHVIFRNTALGPAYGRISISSLASPNGTRFATGLSADRVYGAETGGGFYLRASRRALTTYEAVSFDRDFKIGHKFKLAGAPSRTRISRDGKMAVSTVFVSGDSYNTGGFSTRTTLFDLNLGTAIADLEEFSVRKEGRPFKAQDFNFWGVTFAPDENTFYATLASGDVPYLIEGQISNREARVLRAGVECPSLSPDGSRLVFKSRVVENGRRAWRLHVLDLKSNAETIVSETRNVDDQAEWLDNSRVIYALSRDTGGTGRTDLWVSAANGSGSPQLFLSDATSPSVILPK